jgi:PAS domain S-box-containing protein
MPRKLLVLALVIVGLHVGEVLTLGSAPAGSLLANALQILTSGIAAAMCFDASRRGHGMSRPFWLLAGCGMATWGVANLGWTYYENWLHTEPPTPSVIRFLFDAQSLFFAMTLFLNEEKDSAKADAESLLDFLQIAIVFFLIYHALYYVPALDGDPVRAQNREVWVYELENLTLVVFAGIRLARARTSRCRTLYRGLTVYLAFFTGSTAVAEYAQSVQKTPTGTWYDLGWTLPLMAGAFWAARWTDSTEECSASAIPSKTPSRLAIKNIMFALAPLFVLALIVNPGPGGRLPSFVLLGVSILCYAARLSVGEYRQSQAAETALQHRLAMETAINGMAILDAEGRHIYVNPAYARMMGHLNSGAMIGRPWREVSNPGDTAPVENDICTGLKQHGKWFGPVTIHHRDGTIVPLEMTITGLPGGGVVCVSRDITQRVSSQRAYAEAETKYRLLIEQAAAISYIAELGLHGQWHYVSPQVETILGYSTEEWLEDSRDWMRHIPPEDHGIVETAEEVSSRGEPFQAEYRIKRKDGKVIWVSDSAVVVRGSNSHPVMEGLIVDITERKQLENQLQQSRRVEAVGRLAGGIAHDFNNLLTIIKGYTELALSRPAIRPEIAADVQQIGNAAERASALIRQLLAFSRKQVLQPKSLDVNSIVENLDKLLRRLIGADIEMVTLCGVNVGTVKADPAQIEQVIMNLVVNARDAMPIGGRLTIETANVELDSTYARDHTSVKPGRYVMVAVSDTGIGMDAQTQAHIFEPFFTTKESGRGTGLGLSTVYGIVKQSGGYIWVYSEPDHGSTFKVYLPRVDEPVEAASSATDETSTRRGTETILLVEDEEAIRELTRVILAGQGYNVVVAESTTHAEQLSARYSGEIDLLLTDVVMPGTGGRELARRITGRHPRIRVLYTSGYSDNVITQSGVLDPGVAFLQKPFTPRGLAAKVREVLDAVLAK